jgi:hypothetical protein
MENQQLSRAIQSIVTVAVVTFLVYSPACRGIDPIVSRYGIGTVFHPLQEPDKAPEPNPYPGQVVRYRKEHVYTFAINGLNPLCLGNFNGLCGYLKDQGFTNTYFGQLYSSYNFAKRAKEIRATDPEAKIVLLGFSLGSNYVKSIANELDADGTKVDLLIYLVGDYVKNEPSSRPKNVARVVNVRAKGSAITGGDYFFNGEDIEGARNQKLECRHILTPSRKETVEIVLSELLLVCAEPVPAGETTDGKPTTSTSFKPATPAPIPAPTPVRPTPPKPPVPALGF